MVRGLEDKIIDSIIFIILAIVGIAAVVPILYVLSISITPFSEVLKNGGFVIIPKSITLDAYSKLFSQDQIPQAFKITVLITVVGTLINLVLTTLTAYPISRKSLPGRNLFIYVIVFTLLFSGGIVPTYLIVQATGLINSIWAMIIPNAIWSFNVLIMKSFFENLPEELFESAKLDGAGEFRVLWKIVLPLSLPIILTILLFYAVGHWNEFFQATMYITNRQLQPLQIVVRDILLQNQDQIETNVDSMVPTATLQMAAVMVASMPIILVYPFIQKHFTKGMLLGSLKG